MPARFTDMYPNVTYKNRKMCLGMISAVDEAIANVTQLLKSRGMWDDTLAIFTSDK